MPDLHFHFADHHTRVEVDGTLLTGGRLNICLLQLPPTVDEAVADAGRPVAVNALRDLLAGGPNHDVPALQHMMPGAGPVLVIAPEFALGSGDWDTVDALVRASNRPLVLVIGFGATLGQRVLDWQGGGEDIATQRHLAWRQQVNPISPVMRVNGGWCWIHRPGGETHCLVYLKNVLQQAFEAVVLDDLQTGETLLHLRFDDVDLLPLICADLVQPAAQNPASPQARVRGALGEVAPDRPALVVGSLLQLGYSDNWAIAVDSVLNAVLAGRTGAVALCNVAYDHPEADEARDKWRSLSGVFAAYGELTKGQASLPATRALNAQGVVGAVVRQTHASATTGVVAWAPYNPVNGNLVWRGNMVCPIRGDGFAAPIAAAPGKAACEIARFLRRHPPDAHTAPRLGAGIAEIGAHLNTSEAPDAPSLLEATLGGIAGGKPIDPDALHNAEVTSALKAGLHALAALKSVECVAWQTGTGLTGQLKIDAQARHLLVWRSAVDSPRAIKRHLANWRLRGGTHPDLVVLGSTRMGDLADEEITDDRRDDISLAPAPEMAIPAGGSLAPAVGDITAARGRLCVATLGLSHIAAVYADYEPGEDATRVATLVGRIGAVFDNGGEA